MSKDHARVGVRSHRKRARQAQPPVTPFVHEYAKRVRNAVRRCRIQTRPPVEFTQRHPDRPAASCGEALRGAERSIASSVNDEQAVLIEIRHRNVVAAIGVEITDRDAAQESADRDLDRRTRSSIYSAEQNRDAVTNRTADHDVVDVVSVKVTPGHVGGTIWN
jgi:hypothetical protein